MKYYNNDDTQSVSNVKDILETKYSTEFKRTKEFSVFDLRDETLKIFAEVKKRNNTISFVNIRKAHLYKKIL